MVLVFFHFFWGIKNKNALKGWSCGVKKSYRDWDLSIYEEASEAKKSEKGW
jgi:hypothetical protein